MCISLIYCILWYNKSNKFELEDRLHPFVYNAVEFSDCDVEACAIGILSAFSNGICGNFNGC